MISAIVLSHVACLSLPRALSRAADRGSAAGRSSLGGGMRERMQSLDQRMVAAEVPMHVVLRVWYQTVRIVLRVWYHPMRITLRVWWHATRIVLHVWYQTVRIVLSVWYHPMRIVLRVCYHTTRLVLRVC
eukprot:986269-Rhodomonas_salina.2